MPEAAEPKEPRTEDAKPEEPKGYAATVGGSTEADDEPFDFPVPHGGQGSDESTPETPPTTKP
jgi:hypothetical protein